MAGLSEYFNESIKREVEYIEGSYTRYKNMEVNPRWLDNFVFYMKELEALLPVRYQMTSRGTGLNWLACSFCGVKEEGAQPDMAAYIQSEDLEAITDLFKQAGVTLHLDKKYQVKVGSCSKCLPKLKALSASIGGCTYSAPGTISLKKLEDCKLVGEE